MKIIESKNGDCVARALQRVLPIFGIEKDMPLILVNADISIDEMLGVIDEIKAGERPVIFYSFYSQEELEARGNPASKLFYRTDVGFIKNPFELTELKKLYDFLVSGKKIANPAMEAFLSVGVNKRLVDILLHDICHEDFVPKVLEKAKKEFGFVGSEEDVKNRLEAIREKGGDQEGGLAEKWKDKIFPGVFCDIEGTLFVDSKVNDKVLEMLKRHSETKPVTLWSGGALGEIKKKLLADEIIYPLVSKYAFRGCDVEVVIDDLPKDEFMEKYGILSCEYVQVKK